MNLQNQLQAISEHADELDELINTKARQDMTAWLMDPNTAEDVREEAERILEEIGDD